MVLQGMLEDIDAKEKVAHISYKDMEQLDFQIMLTDNYYVNLNSTHMFSNRNLKSFRSNSRHRRRHDNCQQYFWSSCKRN